ncbi:Glycosyl transferase family 2 [Candidatus Electrothrix marina]|uniref:Glycosyl transferase family 2 n=1 Tax=Candidatus Electrothrix marina TaxID=1859130 RepID=A0A3S3QJZ0_9BACT|nr:Glycosyl transferase family 2 [Candidatus Electrothrix marina]
MSVRKIIGIVLVKNEELYIERVLNNIKDFCDEIIVADNLSSDQTPDRVQALQNDNPTIIYHRIRCPSASHELIRKYCGKNVWIFGVDGDELYDPKGLKKLRGALLRGDYDDRWMILGNVLNAIEVTFEKKFARGYLAPPCRSMTKLYNFAAIDAWSGYCSERLHGGQIVFRPGFSHTDRFYMYKEVEWQNSCFRCLHLCFIPRSNKEQHVSGELVIRKNIADRLSEGMVTRCVSRVKKLLGVTQKSPWKREKYMQGELVTCDISSFLP